MRGTKEAPKEKDSEPASRQASQRTFVKQVSAASSEEFKFSPNQESNRSPTKKPQKQLSTTSSFVITENEEKDTAKLQRESSSVSSQGIEIHLNAIIPKTNYNDLQHIPEVSVVQPQNPMMNREYSTVSSLDFFIAENQSTTRKMVKNSSRITFEEPYMSINTDAPTENILAVNNEKSRQSSNSSSFVIVENEDKHPGDKPQSPLHLNIPTELGEMSTALHANRSSIPKTPKGILKRGTKHGDKPSKIPTLQKDSSGTSQLLLVNEKESFMDIKLNQEPPKDVFYAPNDYHLNNQNLLLSSQTETEIEISEEAGKSEHAQNIIRSKHPEIFPINKPTLIRSPSAISATSNKSRSKSDREDKTGNWDKSTKVVHNERSISIFSDEEGHVKSRNLSENSKKSKPSRIPLLAVPKQVNSDVQKFMVVPFYSRNAKLRERFSLKDRPAEMENSLSDNQRTRSGERKSSAQNEKRRLSALQKIRGNMTSKNSNRGRQRSPNQKINKTDQYQSYQVRPNIYQKRYIPHSSEQPDYKQYQQQQIPYSHIPSLIQSHSQSRKQDIHYLMQPEMQYGIDSRTKFQKKTMEKKPGGYNQRLHTAPSQMYRSQSNRKNEFPFTPPQVHQPRRQEVPQLIQPTMQYGIDSMSKFQRKVNPVFESRYGGYKFAPAYAPSSPSYHSPSGARDSYPFVPPHIQSNYQPHRQDSQYLIHQSSQYGIESIARFQKKVYPGYSGYKQGPTYEAPLLLHKTQNVNRDGHSSIVSNVQQYQQPRRQVSQHLTNPNFHYGTDYPLKFQKNSSPVMDKRHSGYEQGPAYAAPSQSYRSNQRYQEHQSYNHQHYLFPQVAKHRY